MTLSAVPAAPEATSGAAGLEPLRLPPELRLTPEQFALVCAENREAFLELAAVGSLVVISPMEVKQEPATPGSKCACFSGLISRGD
jgi:hypothetical protein